MLVAVASEVVVQQVAGGGRRDLRGVRPRRLVEVLAAANADDPWVRWTLPDAGAARSLYSLFLRTVAFPHGWVLVGGDPAAGVGEVAVADGIAVLLGPEPPPDPRWEVGAEVMALHGRRLTAAVDADQVLERHRPDPPGWVLHTLAVHPDAQGTGVGSALLAAVVELAGGGPVSLETASPAARDWYRRRGFAVDVEVALGELPGLAGAPTVWLLSGPSR